MNSKQLLYYAIKYNNNYFKIRDAIQKKEKYFDITCQYKFITILDDSYPKKLKRIKYPPFVLFYLGDIKLFDNKIIEIRGNEIVSKYSRYLLSFCNQNLSTDIVILSYLKKGIDSTFNYYNGCRKKIFIVSDLSNISPKKNELYISEFLKEINFNFKYPFISRISCGILDKVIFIEPTEKDLIYIDELLVNGVDMYTFPVSINDKNGEIANKLIKDGIGVLVDIKDIVDL